MISTATSSIIILIVSVYCIKVGVSIKCYCTSGSVHDCDSDSLCTTNNNDKSYCESKVLTDGTFIAGCINKQSNDFPTAPCLRPNDGHQSDSNGFIYCCWSDYCNRCPPDITCTYLPNVTVTSPSPHCNTTVCSPSSHITSLNTVSTTTVSPSITPSHQSSPTTLHHIIIPLVCVTLLILTVVIITIVLIYICISKRHNIVRSRNNTTSANNIQLDDGGFNGEMDDDITLSGISSGCTGPRLLNRRTISHDITLNDMIGKGRIGTVYIALYDGEPLAVKVFKSRHREEWAREVEIYDTYLIQHENILKFRGSDSIDLFDHTEFRTYFDYHVNGTLQDYLRQKDMITYSECVTMAISLTEGLQYLHKTIIATRTKPGIAHRDLKSSNILVKKDHSLCIADLGMAVKQSEQTVDKQPSNKLSGTKRYMAPEILSGKMNYEKFNSYMMSDVYSLSLILWEIFNRCLVNGVGQPYSLPYAGLVPQDPTIEQMRQCVHILGHRPTFPATWINANDNNLNCIQAKLNDCWAADQYERPAALSIRNEFKKLDTKTSMILD